MNIRRPRRPSPSLAVAAVALFASLGGTGVAATRLASSGPAPRAHIARSLSKTEVNKLIAGYLKAHHVGARGRTGAAGATGAQGATGPQGAPGPGATLLQSTIVGEGLERVSNIGPWTIYMNCHPGALVSILGPGSIAFTESTGTMGSTATTQNDSMAIGLGVSLQTVAAGEQESVHGFLTASNEVLELNLQVAVVHGLANTCSLEGDAIPTTA
jgi:hypothetical protein